MTRQLAVVLGDQLDPASPILDGLDPAQDAVWMAEVVEESIHPVSHKQRIVVFLAAMRHLRDALRARGITVYYSELGQGGEHGHGPGAGSGRGRGAEHNQRSDNRPPAGGSARTRESHSPVTLTEQLEHDLAQIKPQRIIMLEAGDYRLEQEFLALAERVPYPFEVLPDPHFYVARAEFMQWLGERKQPRLEHFYRALRKRFDVLMDGDEPRGGKWNFDAENRKAFSRAGPELSPPRPRFAPDATTTAVIDTVQTHFPDHPGSLDGFNWPVTPEDARVALDDFVSHRLATFGRYQDAMWTDAPFLNHSLLSVALNLKLINPRVVVETVIERGRSNGAPMASVEGFVRQVLGWREYVRGLYWARMPDYLEQNALSADMPLPAFYWHGETEMVCMAQTIGQTLKHGYAHHIQRLIVTGLFALLVGVEPRQVHEWYLGIYVDAVEWVELPNTLGMSQFADGGVMASKPYVASGKYIDRMSNYCRGCRFKPDRRSGPDACPFTVLFWDFLMRHEARFGSHPRTSLMWRNLAKIQESERGAIRATAVALRHEFAQSR